MKMGKLFILLFILLMIIWVAAVMHDDFSAFSTNFTGKPHIPERDFQQLNGE